MGTKGFVFGHLGDLDKKIFHLESKSKTFNFFCSKLHGNCFHSNPLVANTRHDHELCKVLKTTRHYKDAGYISEPRDRDAVRLLEEAGEEPGSKIVFSLFHLCLLVSLSPQTRDFCYLPHMVREDGVENGCSITAMFCFS